MQLSSAACLVSECSAGTVQVGLFILPLLGRLRLMMFSALFSILITCLMLFLDISTIALMFPFNWGKVVSKNEIMNSIKNLPSHWNNVRQLIFQMTCIFQNTYLYLGVGLLFIIASTLILHTVLFAEAFVWVPRYTKDTLFISAVSTFDPRPQPPSQRGYFRSTISSVFYPR